MFFIHILHHLLDFSQMVLLVQRKLIYFQSYCQQHPLEIICTSLIMTFFTDLPASFSQNFQDSLILYQNHPSSTIWTWNGNWYTFNQFVTPPMDSILSAKASCVKYDVNPIVKRIIINPDNDVIDGNFIIISTTNYIINLSV